MTHEARSLWLSSRSFGPVPAVRLPSPNYRPLLFLSNVSSRVAECTVPAAVSSVESRPVAPRSRRRSLFLARSPPETFNHREKEAEDPRQDRWRCCSYAAWRSASSTTRGTGDFFFFPFPLLRCKVVRWNFIRTVFIVIERCKLRYAYYFKLVLARDWTTRNCK